MRKKIVLMALLLTFFSAWKVSAQILVLHLADGTTLDVELDAYRPEVRFQDDKVLVRSAGAFVQKPNGTRRDEEPRKNGQFVRPICDQDEVSENK